MTKQVLLVDDDREVREALGQTLELADLNPVLAGSYIEAKDHITDRFDGIIVTDIRMPGRDGFHLLEQARQVDPDLPVILLTGEGDVPMAVKAISAGAHDFLEKPCAPADLVAVVQKALLVRHNVLEARQHRLQLESGDAASRMLFGTSDLSKELRQRVRSVAQASAEVLVIGEAGSGTPKVAEVIHLLSPAARHPFVKRAGAALTPETLQDALNATGAGSFYIDEVATMPLSVQYALLEQLESGGAVRILAGSTRDLETEVTEGRFVADLFYRLDLMRVRIPALRERPDDIPVLFRHYVALACEQANLPNPQISADFLASLMGQDWPGNARALMNAAMRFAMGVGDAPMSEAEGLADQMARVEKTLLEDALRRSQGRATEAANTLKLPRKTFYDKLTRHGIKADDYRDPS